MQSEGPRLTRREIEVLGLVAEGETDGGIAMRLGISRNTVSHYLENVYRKLGVSSRAAATSWFERHMRGGKDDEV